jgi:hypothetical protein
LKCFFLEKCSSYTTGRAGFSELISSSYTTGRAGFSELISKVDYEPTITMASKI